MPFTRKLFGYDRGQVDAAITKLTFDAADAAQTAERLTAELDRQRHSIDGLRQDHDQLSQALVSAHKAAKEIRDVAERSARAMLVEARQQADEIIRGAEDAVKVIEMEIDTLHKRRREAEETYAAFVESIVKTFECTRANAVKPSLTAFP
jgi:cell division septum initiation protein DivIVA